MSAAAATAAAAAAAAQAAAATRKLSFRRNADGAHRPRLTLHWYVVLTFASPADATQEEEMSQADKAQVKEMLTTLRTEVDELAKTAWLYETNDSVAGCRVNV